MFDRFCAFRLRSSIYNRQSNHEEAFHIDHQFCDVAQNLSDKPIKQQPVSSCQFLNSLNLTFDVQFKSTLVSHNTQLSTSQKETLKQSRKNNDNHISDWRWQNIREEEELVMAGTHDC